MHVHAPELQAIRDAAAAAQADATRFRVEAEVAQLAADVALQRLDEARRELEVAIAATKANKQAADTAQDDAAREAKDDSVNLVGPTNSVHVTQDDGGLRLQINPLRPMRLELRTLSGMSVTVHVTAAFDLHVHVM